MPQQQVPLMTPVKGVVRAVNREGQPPDTCWDAQNVLPWDRYGRKRLAQRGGLSKQYNIAIGNGSQFVQGLIEAPNIIYPPGSLSVPIGSITDLLNPFAFSTPGASGPFTFPYPGSGSIWEWTFTVQIGGSASIGAGGSGWYSNLCTIILYWPMVSGIPAESLILEIQADVGFFHNSASSGDIFLNLYSGDPSNALTWVAIGTQAFKTVSFGVNVPSGGVALNCDLSIVQTGTTAITLTAAGATGSPISGTFPFTQNEYPVLACQSVNIPTPSITVGATGALSLTITD